MASKTYTVKSGDTLSGIAKGAGVGVSDITGYKSGDVNKIFPGEQLSLGATEKATGADTTGAKDYASSVKDGLAGLTKPETPTSTTGVDDSYLSTLRSSITGAQKTVSDAANMLAGLKTKAYEEEYAKSGLTDKKTKISTLDQSIASAKAARDEAISKVQANPGLSAALLTGTVSKLSDKANANINNLIAERNSLATDYNTGLSEVGTRVSARTGDAETAYNTAKDALSGITGQAKDYQSALVDALKNKSTADYQTKQLAISLMNAQTAAQNAGKKGNLTLARDSNGQPLYWIDAQGTIVPLSASDTEAAGGGDTGYGSLDTGEAGAGNAPGSKETTTTSVPWYKKLLGIFG